jgi:diguanylate cyclase (GGDEF)-like protein/PAS domain S-box-containing protein
MWRRLGLKPRFLVAVVLSTTLFTVVAASLVHALGERRARSSAMGTVSSLETAVAKTAAIAAYAHDPVLMQEMVDGLARSSLVSGARIVAADGRVLVRAPAGGPAVVARSELRRDLPLASPFDAAETVGALEVDIDVAQVARIASREAWTLVALVAAQSALVAIVIYLAGTRLISLPIQRLAGKLSRLPAGTTELLTVPAGHAHDEIGMLLAAANELLGANARALGRERSLRQAIEKMEAQYRQIFDSTSAGIFVLDRSGRLINGNPTVLRMIGGDKDDMRRLRGSDFLARVFARPDRLREMIEESARTGKTMSSDVELLGTGGRPRWAHCLISVQDVPTPMDERGMIEGVLYDITERKEVERDVRRRAEYDTLTGALNRAATEDEIERLLARAPAGAQPGFTLIYLDLDGFKLVNDRHGHAAGDEVLRVTARRVAGELRRETDFMGRIGGDEFLVVLPHADCSDADATRFAARIVERLCEPFVLEDGTSVSIGVSAGIASFPRHGQHRRELAHAADEAMYAVKRHGKNAYATALTSYGVHRHAPAAPNVDVCSA